jgi:hypothetical protein
MSYNRSATARSKFRECQNKGEVFLKIVNSPVSIQEYALFQRSQLMIHGLTKGEVKRNVRMKLHLIV